MKLHATGLIVGFLLFGSAIACAQDAPATDCDTYAANPLDPQRLAAGVTRKAIDIPKAIAACNDALARYPDTPRLLYQLARAYREGKDYARALPLYRRAAEASYTEAQNVMGTLYRDGEGGVAQDHAQAISWYLKAAERGHTGAQNSLGFMYENGQGTRKDQAQANSWYRKAAEQGYSVAQYNMGIVYANGQGVPKDLAQAAAWYRKAAVQNQADAQNNLGMMYWNGQAVPKDYALAFVWLSKAAASGQQLAANNLVEMRKKNLVPKDTSAAFTEVNAAIAAATAQARVPQSPAPPVQTATGIAILPPQSATTPAAAASGVSGRRIALLIGNSGYLHAPVLANPANDVKALAIVLQAVGFQSVTVKMDLRREEMISALRQFAQAADKADWAVVYYSGHGIEYNGVNYMIPIDAELRADRDIDLESIDVGKALGALEGAKRLRLIILDACRDNPFVSQMRRTMGTRSIGRGLARIEPEAGTLVVYAAKHGETALDGDGANSPFAEALIKRMPTANLEIRRLFDLVRDDVMNTTSRKQQPFSYGSLSGSEDYFFVTQ